MAIDPHAPPPAWQELLAHRAWVERLARSLAPDVNDADDLAQDAWLRAARTGPSTARSPRGWLATVLRRLAMDRWRAAARRRRHETASIATRTAASSDEPAERVELQRRVTKAVLELHEPLRGAVLLRYVGEHPVAEVARLQGVPLETARTRLRRALEALRTRLDPNSSGGRAAVAIGGSMAVGTNLTLAAGAVAAGLGLWALTNLAGSDATTPPASHPLERAAGADARRAEIAARTPRLEGQGAAGDAHMPSSAVPAPPAPPVPPEADAVPEAWRPGGERVVGQVVDKLGRRIAAAVHLQVLGEGGPVELVGQDAHATPNEDGWFAYDGLPKGEYLVTIHAHGFIGQSYAVQPGAGPVRVALDPAFPIGGVVVEAGTNVPVPGLVVMARSALSPRGGQPYVAVSDAEGRFEVGALPAGSYVVTIGPAGGLLAQSPWVEREVGTLEAGQRDVRIEAMRGLVIAGEVHDARGRPVTAPVTIEALGLTDLGDRDYARRRRVSTGPEGRFRLEGLLSGRYDLSFEVVERPVEGAEPVGAATLVSGVLAGTETLVVVLRQGGSISGRVVDEAGKPIEVLGALYIYPEGTDASSQESIVMPLGAGGTFRSPGLDPARTFDLLATGFRGYLPGTQKRLRPGTADLILTLLEARTIRGRVVDEAGNAVPDGVPVLAFARSAAPGAPGSSWVAYTRSGGSFELEALGPYAFTLRPGGGDSAYLGEPSAGAFRTGATDVLLRVKVGATLSGRLLDVAGNPVRTHFLGATVSGGGPCVPSSTSVTADDGRFTLRGLPQGTVHLRALLGGSYADLGQFQAPADGVDVRVPK